MTHPDFVGDQTPKVFDEHSAVYFFSRMQKMSGVSVNTDRIPLNAAKKYKNVEDILSDVSLIPLETREYTVQELKTHVSQDALVPFPTFFPEFSILAHAGKAALDKPIAFVNHPDGAYYVPHKEIAKYIRRVPVGGEA